MKKPPEKERRNEIWEISFRKKGGESIARLAYGGGGHMCQKIRTWARMFMQDAGKCEIYCQSFIFSLAEKIRESVGGGGGEVLAAASEGEGKTYDTFRVETGKYGSQGRWRKDGEKRKRCERRLYIRHFRTPVFNGSYKPAPLVLIQL